MDRSLTLFELKISYDKLQKASKQEAAFFLRAMTALNDISVLQKAILYTSNAIPKDFQASLEASAQVAQSFCFIRVLAGVLFETHKLSRLAFFCDQINSQNKKAAKFRNKIIRQHALTNLADTYLPLMSPDEQKAQKEIDEYFSNSKNVMRRLRDKFGFHYDFIEALAHMSEFSKIDDPHIFLEEAGGNCCYVGANQWLFLQALKVDPNNLSEIKKKFEAVMKDVVSLARNFETFLNGYILIFGKKYLDIEQARAIERRLDNVMFLEEIKAPFFFKIIKSDAEREVARG